MKVKTNWFPFNCFYFFLKKQYFIFYAADVVVQYSCHVIFIFCICTTIWWNFFEKLTAIYNIIAIIFPFIMGFYILYKGAVIIRDGIYYLIETLVIHLWSAYTIHLVKCY